jgi:hypothetical protein
MLKFIAIGLWLIGTYANYVFFYAFNENAAMSLIFAAFVQLSCTYIEHIGIRQYSKYKKDSLMIVVVIIAAAIDSILTASGIFVALLNLPKHALGLMIEAAGANITNGFLVILSITVGFILALATEVIYNAS